MKECCGHGLTYCSIYFIKWHCMCDLPANLSPDLVNKDKNWFFLISMVLVLRTINPSGLIMWFWVKYPSLYIFEWRCVILLCNWSDKHLLILILVLGCCWKWYVHHIQTRHTYLSSPQALGRLWRGFWLGVNNRHQ